LRIKETLAEKKIGIILSFFGAIVVSLSIIFQTSIFAFIGLTFLLWGLIFLLVIPVKYIKSDVIDGIVETNRLSLEKIISQSNVEGTPIYMPSPKEPFVASNIGINTEFVYIPDRNDSLEALTEQALMRRPKGIRIIPPGLGLANLIEKKSKLDFNNSSISSVMDVLPAIITNDLEIANNLKVNLESNRIKFEIERPVFEEVCKQVQQLENISQNIGCPICSSLACIVARVTKTPVIIESCQSTNSGNEATFIIQGELTQERMR